MVAAASPILTIARLYAQHASAHAEHANVHAELARRFVEVVEELHGLAPSATAASSSTSATNAPANDGDRDTTSPASLFAAGGTPCTTILPVGDGVVFNQAGELVAVDNDGPLTAEETAGFRTARAILAGDALPATFPNTPPLVQSRLTFKGSIGDRRGAGATRCALLEMTFLPRPELPAFDLRFGPAPDLAIVNVVWFATEELELASAIELPAPPGSAITFRLARKRVVLERELAVKCLFFSAPSRVE